MLYLESPPQVTSLSTKFMHERGGVPQLDKYRASYSVGGARLPHQLAFATPTSWLATPIFHRFWTSLVMKWSHWPKATPWYNILGFHVIIRLIFIVFAQKKNQPTSLFAPPTFPKKLHPWGNAARTARRLKQLKRSKKIQQVVTQSLIAVMLNPRPTGGAISSPLSRFLAISSKPMQVSPPNLQYPLSQHFYTLC